MTRVRKPLRIVKTYDEYKIETGGAGFVILIKNGKRIMPKHFKKTFNLRRTCNAKPN